MAFFHMRLIPPRPSFPFDASEPELEAMARHADYWRGLAADKVAIAAGPVFDPAGTFGVAIVDAADETAAVRLGADDPVIAARLGFSWTVAPIPSLILRT